MKYIQSKTGEVFTTESPEFWTDCKTLSAKAGKALHIEQSKQKLLDMIKPGQTVYCILRHVSTSGMSRRISLAVCEDGNMRNIDYLVSIATSFKLGKDGLIVSGCGMDMGFHVVYTLGYCLWPNGTPTAHGSRNGAPDSNGGYALKSQWI